MTGIEPGSSGIVSDRSANCATTTSQKFKLTLCIELTFTYTKEGLNKRCVRFKSFEISEVTLNLKSAKD